MAACPGTQIRIVVSSSHSSCFCLSYPDASAAVSPVPTEPILRHAGWRRLGFRFLALYLTLYCLPQFIGPIPWLNYLGWFNFQLWEKMVPLVGEKILHLPPITIRPNGSGDTTFNYVQILSLLMVAGGGAVIWMWFDRKRRYDPLVLEIVRTIVRYTLAMTMLTYGAIKMLHQQMPAPMLHQLVTPYSEFSPMGLLWRFMGFSPAYSFFAGFSEFAGGLLLFFRRTTTLGSLILSAVLFHVMLMNFCFDVPVKIYSSHLLFCALFLAAPDFRRLVNVLVLHRPVPAVTFDRSWWKAWMKPAAVVTKALLIGLILYQIPIAHFKQWLKSPVRPELYGLYEVQEFKIDNTVVVPTTSSSARWQRLFITEYGVTLEYTNTQKAYFTASSSLKDHKLTFTSREAPSKIFELTVERPKSDVLIISGLFNDHRIDVEFRRVDETKFPLLSRGFHWVSEYPYNR